MRLVAYCEKCGVAVPVHSGRLIDLPPWMVLLERLDAAYGHECHKVKR